MLKQRNQLEMTILVFSVFLVATLSATGPVEGSSAYNGKMTLILDELLNGYDRRLRPGFGGSPLVVKTDILVRSMGPICERSMMYSMDCYFRQLWVDKRLAFNVSMPNISLNIKMLERLWHPDTIFLNGGRSYVHMVPMPNKFFRINKDGTILYSQRLTISATCRMHLEKYPLDSQRCPLYVGSFAYSTDDVIYEWRFGVGKSVEIASDMTLSQFDLLYSPSSNSTEMFKGALHSILTVHFYLRRHMGYFLINVYVPCCLLVVLSWVSFWINREATSDRIALGTTTVLTMTFIGLDNRNDLPRVSYSTAMDVYVAMCFVFVLATIIQFACVHYFTKYGCGEAQSDIAHKARKANEKMTEHYDDDDVGDGKEADFPRQTSNGSGGPHINTTPIQPIPTATGKKKTVLHSLWMCFFGTRNIRHNSQSINVLGLNSVSKIDRFSRIFFPAIFLLLNVAYWTIYLEEGLIFHKT